MRAEQAMMIGVSLLGAFAVYKMVTAKQAEAPTPNTPLLPGTPTTPNVPDGNGLILLGDPLTLVKGQYYRGRLVVSGTNIPFTADATVDVLSKSLAALGFADIHVFMTLKDLPTDWPSNQVNSQRIALSTDIRYFQGVWQAANINLPRPSTLDAFWATPRPANAISTSGYGNSYGRMTG